MPVSPEGDHRFNRHVLTEQNSNRFSPRPHRLRWKHKTQCTGGPDRLGLCNPALANSRLLPYSIFVVFKLRAGSFFAASRAARSRRSTGTVALDGLARPEPHHDGTEPGTGGQPSAAARPVGDGVLQAPSERPGKSFSPPTACSRETKLTKQLWNSDRLDHILRSERPTRQDLPGAHGLRVGTVPRWNRH